MIYTSLYLTIMTLLFVVLMFFVTSKVGGKASNYFVGRQKSIADMNGFKDIDTACMSVALELHKTAATLPPEL